MWNESFPHALKEEKHEWVKSETTKQLSAAVSLNHTWCFSAERGII